VPTIDGSRAHRRKHVEHEVGGTLCEPSRRARRYLYGRTGRQILSSLPGRRIENTPSQEA